MDNIFFEAVESSPVISAVKDLSGLEKSLTSETKVVFILFGDICNIAEIVEKVNDANKIAMVHIDLISGLGGKEIAVDFIKNTTKAGGIISTKPALIKRAKELGMFTILRIFLIDSLAFQNIEKQNNLCKPDFIEILPGVMPKIISRVNKNGNFRIIAGGLITEKSDVVEALSAGAMSISTTSEDVWFL